MVVGSTPAEGISTTTQHSLCAARMGVHHQACPAGQHPQTPVKAHLTQHTRARPDIAKLNRQSAVPTVLIADDHQLFLEAMSDLLTARDWQVVGLAHTGREALTLARQHRPDAILMDIQMPQCSGLEATRLIKAELPDTIIVILTSSDDDDDLFEAIKSGAAGYLLKSMGGQAFFDQFESALRGEAPLAPGLASRLLKEFARQAQQVDARLSAPPPAQHTAISDVEIEILKQVGHGHTYKEIGQTLYLSERTVKYHMSKLLKRLQLQNREQVLAYAAQRGWLAGE